MYCNNCGNVVQEASQFCGHCGIRLSSPSPRSAASSSFPAQNQHYEGRKPTLALRFILFLIAAVVITIAVVGKSRNEQPEDSTHGATTLPDTIQQAAAETRPTPTPIPPPSPADRKIAEKQIRDAYAREAQKELWREGMEMTLQARGATLHIEYTLAGKAFAFQFGESFVSKNADRLRLMGFRRVELTDGDSSEGLAADHIWSWNLNR